MSAIVILVLAAVFAALAFVALKIPIREFSAAAGFVFAASAFFLAGCAGPVTKSQSVSASLAAAEKEKQQEVAFATWEKHYSRLNDVAFPIQRAAAPLCGESVKDRAGFSSSNRYDYDDAWRDIAAKHFGLGERFKVIRVTRDSPAEDAGLKVGDELLSADGAIFPTGANASAKFSEIYASAVNDGEVVLDVLRDHRRQSVTIRPVKVCAHKVQLTQNDSVNAFADGDKVYITTGMMRFAETDQELALVVAHELAHNAMRHSAKQQQNRIGGAIVGGLVSGLACAYGGVCSRDGFGIADAAGRAHSKEFEAEADYVGLYMMARAGMEIEGAANFWRRMAAEHPGNIASNHAATHPSTPERFVALEKTVAEIKRKQAQGLELMPDLKE